MPVISMFFSEWQRSRDSVVDRQHSRGQLHFDGGPRAVPLPPQLPVPIRALALPVHVVEWQDGRVAAVDSGRADRTWLPQPSEYRRSANVCCITIGSVSEMPVINLGTTATFTRHRTQITSCTTLTLVFVSLICYIHPFSWSVMSSNRAARWSAVAPPSRDTRPTDCTWR